MHAPVLGLGGSNHDFSAAIVIDDAIAVAVEDERVQRIKNGRATWFAEPARSATEYCLAATGLELGDIEHIYCCDDLERPRPWLDWSQVEFIDHHLAHASAAYFTSPFDEAALLVVDGHGSALVETESHYEVETISMGCANGIDVTLSPHQTGLQRKTSSSWRYITTHSIGWFYELVTMALGFGGDGQGKTMGLAAYGSSRYVDEMSEFVVSHEDGHFEFDPYAGISDWLSHTTATARNPMQARADIAYAAQEIFVRAIVVAAREAHRRAPLPALAFGGGCALNTVANSRILQETPFEQLWVFPAAGDNGLSVGAAFYGAHAVLRQERQARCAGWRGRTVYTGRIYADDEITTALEAAPVFANRPSDLAAEVARALLRGDTVALYRGGSEIGPRALGHRSLIALPATARMRDHINLDIKDRESFRPLAPVVPIEDVARCFEGVCESPYMLLVAYVRAEMRDRLAAVTHVDGTARVQTVREEDNSFLHALLRLIGDATGLPVLLNTSLNGRGEPIVETPADALKLFIERPIDTLVLGDYVVSKYSPWARPASSSTR